MTEAQKFAAAEVKAFDLRVTASMIFQEEEAKAEFVDHYLSEMEKILNREFNLERWELVPYLEDQNEPSGEGFHIRCSEANLEKVARQVTGYKGKFEKCTGHWLNYGKFVLFEDGESGPNYWIR